MHAYKIKLKHDIKPAELKELIVPWRCQMQETMMKVKLTVYVFSDEATSYVNDCVNHHSVKYGERINQMTFFSSLLTYDKRVMCNNVYLSCRSVVFWKHYYGCDLLPYARTLCLSTNWCHRKRKGNKRQFQQDEGKTNYMNLFCCFVPTEKTSLTPINFSYWSFFKNIL